MNKFVIAAQAIPVCINARGVRYTHNDFIIDSDVIENAVIPEAMYGILPAIFHAYEGEEEETVVGEIIGNVIDTQVFQPVNFGKEITVFVIPSANGQGLHFQVLDKYGLTAELNYNDFIEHFSHYNRYANEGEELSYNLDLVNAAVDACEKHRDSWSDLLIDFRLYYNLVILAKNFQ